VDRGLGRSQSRSIRNCEEKNSQLLPGLNPPIILPVDRLLQEIPVLYKAHREWFRLYNVINFWFYKERRGILD
jgi:hypothetical protein